VSNPNPILRFFAYDHLRSDMRDVGELFHVAAHKLYVMLPDNAEKSTALRKLLEAKDAAVRAGWIKRA
jgi:hypothetical protein